MANCLKMAMVNGIDALLEAGWSQRRIARALGIDRGTVARYTRRAREAANTATAPPGSNRQEGAVAAEGPAANAATAPPGSRSPSPPSGSASRCEPFEAIIQAKLEIGLSAKRIHQDLVAEHDFAAQYPSVRRFVQRLGRTRPLPFRRMECDPGQEAQIDFGKGAPIISADGKRRRTHVLRVVLSHSRKAYSEAVFRQTTDDFIRCIENAFRHFGGVPRTLVPDNLKAAVIRADGFDPDLNPKIQAFADHYGTAILPTKPRTPRHQGKVERGVDYVQENGLKGHTFTSLEAQNRHLLEWETAVADTRIHGTTRKHVGKVFEDVERPALLPIPVERFSFFHESRRTVHRDGHVEVAKAYYSAPPEYLGRELWARWDGHTVRLFNQRMEQIAFHLQQEPGRFSTQNQHIASEKISGVERGIAWPLRRVALLGPHSQRWAEAMLHDRGIEGARVLQGLLSLSNRHENQQIEEACKLAQSHGAYRLRVLRELIKRRGSRQDQFEFIQEHPIIRSLSEYGRLVHAVVQEDPPSPIQECCP
jgi:transposase